MPDSYTAVLYVFLFGLSVTILRIAASWKIFTKAGESGWKCLIPLYSTYTQYKIAWDTRYFPVFLVFFAGELVLSRIEYSTLPSLWLLLIFTIANLVLYAVSLHKLSKAFGHGIGFTIGLFFCNPIFALILGFDSSQYQGPQ